ncbi:MAG TPA: hypothetical protein VKV19_14690 [Ktedonobacteraceae bacterium]|jgi:dTDP-4-amino-4,6-dideoxygalactose transaminase|nr:hypothetical protein [Ktedonobacteraceae bacterium]
MAQWAYKVAYIDYRGRISCEGLETLRRDNERRSAFVRRYMNTLGRDNWELVGIQPLTGNSAYYVFKRPAQEGDFAEETPAAGAQQAQPTVESA